MPQEATFAEVIQLIDKFKWERFVYLILVSVCTVVIMIVAIIAIIKKDPATGLSLFAPGGMIYVSLSRVFKIWDDMRDAFFKAEVQTNNSQKND